MNKYVPMDFIAIVFKLSRSRNSIIWNVIKNLILKIMLIVNAMKSIYFFPYALFYWSGNVFNKTFPLVS